MSDLFEQLTSGSDTSAESTDNIFGKLTGGEVDPSVSQAAAANYIGRQALEDRQRHTEIAYEGVPSEHVLRPRQMEQPQLLEDWGVKRARKALEEGQQKATDAQEGDYQKSFTKFSKVFPEVPEEGFKQVYQQAYQGQAGQAQGQYFSERFGKEGQSGAEYAAERLPFAGGFFRAGEILETNNAAKRIQEGNGTAADQALVAKSRAQIEVMQSHGLQDKVLDMLSHAPAFATELMTTGGVGKAAAGLMPAKLGMAGQRVGYGLGMAAANPQMSAPGVAQRMGEGEGVLSAVGKEFGSQAIQLGTMGMAAGKLGGLEALVSMPIDMRVAETLQYAAGLRPDAGTSGDLVSGDPERRQRAIQQIIAEAITGGTIHAVVSAGKLAQEGKLQQESGAMTPLNWLADAERPTKERPATTEPPTATEPPKPPEPVKPAERPYSSSEEAIPERIPEAGLERTADEQVLRNRGDTAEMPPPLLRGLGLVPGGGGRPDRRMVESGLIPPEGDPRAYQARPMREIGPELPDTDPRAKPRLGMAQEPSRMPQDASGVPNVAQESPGPVGTLPEQRQGPSEPFASASPDDIAGLSKQLVGKKLKTAEALADALRKSGMDDEGISRLSEALAGKAEPAAIDRQGTIEGRVSEPPTEKPTEAIPGVFGRIPDTALAGMAKNGVVGAQREIARRQAQEQSFEEVHRDAAATHPPAEVAKTVREGSDAGVLQEQSEADSRPAASATATGSARRTPNLVEQPADFVERLKTKGLDRGEEIEILRSLVEAGVPEATARLKELQAPKESHGALGAKGKPSRPEPDDPRILNEHAKLIDGLPDKQAQDIARGLAVGQSREEVGSWLKGGRKEGVSGQRVADIIDSKPELKDAVNRIEESLDQLHDEAADRMRRAAGQLEYGKPAENKVAFGGGQEEAPGAARITKPELQRVTALANEILRKERVKDGLPPVPESEHRGDVEVMAKALENLAADKEAGRRLVAELEKNPRNTDTDENALLLAHKNALMNEYDRVVHDYLRASQERRQAMSGADAIDLKQHEAKLNSLEKQEESIKQELDQLGKVTKKTGSEAGRAFRLRRLLLAEDFSLGGMLQRAERAKGEPLTETEKIRVGEQQQKIDERQKSMSGFEADMEAKTRPERMGMVGEFQQKQLELANAKHDYLSDVAAHKWRSQSPAVKAMDLASLLRRFMVLSNPATLVKILSAGQIRTMITPVEEVIGGVWSKLPVIGRVFAMAPRHGGMNMGAEVQAFAKQFTQGFQDAWTVARGGQAYAESTDHAAGPNTMAHRFLEFPGLLHAALKAPAKRAEYTRSFLKRMDAMSQEGKDPTTPAALTKIGLEAYGDANAAIFMQDNAVATVWRNAEKRLMDKDSSPGAKLVGLASRMIVPIKRVPTNIVAEVFEHLAGLPVGATRAGMAIREGLSSLKPEQADSITRQLKKGSLGAAAVTLGLLAPAYFGGFYSGKRKEDDVEVGGIRTDAGDIPALLLHNPAIEAIQVGAAAARGSDKRIKGHEQGPVAGTGQALAGLIREVPFVRGAEEAAGVVSNNAHDQGWHFGQMMKSMAIPQLVSWMAEQTDRQQAVEGQLAGKKIKRSPQTVLEHVETGIPGLRQNVKPTKKLGMANR